MSTRDLEALLPPLTSLPFHSGLGAEEPQSRTPEDTSSPLSTGYNTRSGSEEMVTEPGASLRGSQELPISTRTRTRTASELLLDRFEQGAVGQGQVGVGQVGLGWGSEPALVWSLQVPTNLRAGGG